LIVVCHCLIPLSRALVAGVLSVALLISVTTVVSGAEAFAAVSTLGEGGKGTDTDGESEGQGSASMPDSHSDILPEPISRDDFAELREHSPFLRTLNISQSLILTGVARIEDDTIATLYDFETRQSYVVSEEASPEGWQLVEVNGDQSDLETLTARVKIAGAEVISIRYDEAPKTTAGSSSVQVSTRIGDGSRGGGTGPHGGPDPRVLTPDQLADARNAARNVRAGFQADGYGDRETIPRDVVEKVSRLSVDQRERINVKMFEYRNRGLGMSERKKIYNGLLDRAVKTR